VTNVTPWPGREGGSQPSWLYPGRSLFENGAFEAASVHRRSIFLLISVETGWPDGIAPPEVSPTADLEFAPRPNFGGPRIAL